MAISLEQAPTGQSKQSMSASRQSINHRQLFDIFFFFFFLGKKPYMSANLANDSNTQQTDKGNVEFSAVKAVELLFKKDVAFQNAMCLHVISRAGTC